MKQFKVKFSFRGKGIETTVKAENKAMAKQKILAEIIFHEVYEEDGSEIMDFLNGFRK